MGYQTSMADDDELLWNLLQVEHKVVIQQFSTSLIGLGALFFAYGSVNPGFLRNTIALVGLGASLILWMHTWGAGTEAHELEEEIARAPRGRTLIVRFWTYRRWRHRGTYRWTYWSVLRLIAYFNGLLVLAWLIVLLYGYGAPLWTLVALLAR
jgi:hypothetical protein